MPTCRKCDDTGTWPILPIRYCDCEIGDQKLRQAVEDAKRTADNKMWQETHVPTRFAHYTLDSHPEPQAVLSIREWLAGAQTGNIQIAGVVGTGKTGLAVALIRERLSTQHLPSRFISAPQMFDDLRPNSDTNPMRELQRAPLLVLDDLGVEKPSDWVRERLYVLINARYENLLPTVVTSNSTLPALTATLGDRIVSRFAEDLTIITLRGVDRRSL